MSPARFQLKLDPGVIAIALQYFEMGHSFAATLKGDGHLDPVFGMAADRGIDDAPFFRNIAVDQGPVRPVRRMFFNLFGQPLMSFIGRDCLQPGGRPCRGPY